MIRCSCGNELVSVEAICEQCDVPVVTWPRYEDEIDDENADFEIHLLDGDDCGMNPQGDCGKAGSEECEFGCPYGRVKRN